MLLAPRLDQKHATGRGNGFVVCYGIPGGGGLLIVAISVQNARPEDYTFARAAHHLAYREVVVSQFGGWDDALQDQFFEAKWRDGNVDILLSDGQPCGFVVVADGGDHLRIMEIVIHPDWQRRGIGTGFLQSVLGRTAERQVPVRLRVLEKNLAIELYKRLGFVEQGRSATHFEFEWTV